MARKSRMMHISTSFSFDRLVLTSSQAQIVICIVLIESGELVLVRWHPNLKDPWRQDKTKGAGTGSASN